MLLLFTQTFNNYSITADLGSFSLSGKDVSLNGHYTFPASGTSFTLNGQDITFRGAYRFSADRGTFSLTGQNVTLNRFFLSPIDNGQFILNGGEVGVFKGYYLNAAPGSYSVGTSRINYWLSAGSGNFALVAPPVTLAKNTSDVSNNRMINISLTIGL